MIAVLREMEGKGPFCSLVMSVTVVKDVLVLLLFAINVEIVAAADAVLPDPAPAQPAQPAQPPCSCSVPTIYRPPQPCPSQSRHTPLHWHPTFAALTPCRCTCAQYATVSVAEAGSTPLPLAGAILPVLLSPLSKCAVLPHRLQPQSLCRPRRVPCGAVPCSNRTVHAAALHALLAPSAVAAAALLDSVANASTRADRDMNLDPKARAFCVGSASPCSRASRVELRLAAHCTRASAAGCVIYSCWGSPYAPSRQILSSPPKSPSWQRRCSSASARCRYYAGCAAGATFAQWPRDMAARLMQAALYLGAHQVAAEPLLVCVVAGALAGNRREERGERQREELHRLLGGLQARGPPQSPGI